jgi:hypothetical protein
MVRSEPLTANAAVRKGIVDRGMLERTIGECRAASPQGWVRVETDMRAHSNPACRRAIVVLGEHLTERLRRKCLRCAAPGFGKIDAVCGLPCRDCGTLISGLLAQSHGCVACDHRQYSPRSDGCEFADPTYCDRCNP